MYRLLTGLLSFFVALLVVYLLPYANIMSVVLILLSCALIGVTVLRIVEKTATTFDYFLLLVAVGMLLFGIFIGLLYKSYVQYWFSFAPQQQI